MMGVLRVYINGVTMLQNQPKVKEQVFKSSTDLEDTSGSIAQKKQENSRLILFYCCDDNIFWRFLWDAKLVEKLMVC